MLAVAGGFLQETHWAGQLFHSSDRSGFIMVDADTPRAASPQPTPVPTWTTPTEGLALFVRGVTVRTASKVALLVGTVLSLVNQGSTIADGNATTATWIRVGVNYLVPFLVSSYGFLAARRRPATAA